MSEPIVTCPNCSTNIPLTASLAAPLIKATQQKYEQAMAAKDRDIAEREASIGAQRELLDRDRAAFEENLAEKLDAERLRIAAEEAAKAKRLAAADLDSKTREVAELSAVLKQRDEKLAEAQMAQAKLMRKERQLEGEKRELELSVEKRVQSRIAEAEASIGAQRELLEKDRAAFEEDFTQKLDAERQRIAAEEAAKAKRIAAADLDSKSRELAELHTILKQRDEKLAEAQTAQAELMRKERELQDEKRELELSVERRVQSRIAVAQEKAKLEAEEPLRLRVLEREEQIASMQRQIDELKRKAEQGSQQLQGEVQEIELEGTLRAKFPRDSIQPVPKGEFGGDILQTVMGPQNKPCGTILWESKRTKHWSDGWPIKLREDQRRAKADVALIVSDNLPKGVQGFAYVDGIWVTEPRYAFSLALALRQSLVEVANARQARDGQQTKMELVYQYLTGPHFRQRVAAIVEKFEEMRTDLEKERTAMTRLWAKREKQIRGVIETTSGMYGDLQGIAGKALEEIEALSLPMIEHRGDEQDQTAAA
ncbi:DUF2130 domain-containing protein [Bradyrhizobium sp. Tv2a-2]|uniref:DUF2130 domain-containing protein n=1 Tax=Bradyrhizobium sp. Tv2a-2 TaxID=113395 RepID=UPI0003FFB189|nr:DUF2130 domain-containing protein [Bradyrhizobium sp. Tv2a-2]